VADHDEVPALRVVSRRHDQVLEDPLLGDRGGELGHVADVAPGIANDVLELDTGLALPMVEDCVRTVELDAGRIVIAHGYA
jgi:ribosomal 30S subunit maturation factor RimM